MRQKGILLFSIFFSVLLHLVFLGTSYFLWVPGAEGLTGQVYKMFDVKSVDIPSRDTTRQVISQSRVQSLRFEKPAAGIEEKLKEHMISPEAIDTTDWAAPSASEPLAPTELPDVLPTAPATLKRLQEDIQPSARQITERPRTAAPRSDQPAAILMSDESFHEEMPGLALEQSVPPAPPGIAAGTLPSFETALPPGFSTHHAYKPDPAHEPLDEILAVQLFTYSDPESGQNYFQVSIYPAYHTEELEVMPKEVVFLMDASLSVRGRRFTEMKEGIQYALMNLNTDDFFNIYAFKDEIIPFQNTSVPATPSNLANAIAFLNRLTATQATNIYRAFAEAAQSGAVINPSYIVLLSDGKVTAGLRSTTSLISEITHKNQRKRPIFTVSGGPGVDRFLLDFLAYPNRGWSEYAVENEGIGEKIEMFYDKIQNPVLLNVRYQVTPLDAGNIYPRHLPDFYRDTIFTLYGTYEEETRFSLRLLGDIGNATKEFIFTYDLDQAPRGSSEIARHWAFNKIYQLISDMTLKGSNPEDIEEIRYLMEKYGIRIPYNFERIL